ncbi:hypothetical protein [Rhizobium sp. SSA_523]|uniref:hypothetical protein n=1 Tax=Rhizobium sp. SSA_523 TaxID=2952477 RepID=UPI0020917F7B|nr:hypothetical protein [Rhizobium sp. SSA_523]MCO5731732.1 hypothetical protein [Rhizobium sp. SSA_523]WKC22895.1 hypothetical protein QTJ18_18875 [Rhizobium sp. SSA_523]
MKTYLCVAVIGLGLLAGCSGGEDEQSDAVDNTPPQSQLDGNTAPASRDPTPVSGTGGDIPGKTEVPAK